MTRNHVYEPGSVTGILGQLKWESLKKRRQDNRLILLYKGLKGKARMHTDYTLFQRLVVAGISTPWSFRYPQPVKISISIASSPRLSGTVITSLNPRCLPLNCQMIAYLRVIENE